MAGKISGLGWETLDLDDSGGTGRNIENDVNSLNIAFPRGVQDVSGVDVFAFERLLLMADASGTLNGTMNVDANKSHAVLKTVSSSSVSRTLALGVASQTLSIETLVTDYQIGRATEGGLTWAAPFVLTGGLVPTWS